jgi:hypothetical protein
MEFGIPKKLELKHEDALSALLFNFALDHDVIKVKDIQEPLELNAIQLN